MSKRARSVKISMLDDYFDTVRTLRCFAKLAPFEITIWNDHVQDDDMLAERLQDTETLVLIRPAPRSARRQHGMGRRSPPTLRVGRSML